MRLINQQQQFHQFAVVYTYNDDAKFDFPQPAKATASCPLVFCPLLNNLSAA
jgi:hypothetical protein